jgi:DNA polymerase III epsilon subunit-like protein
VELTPFYPFVSFSSTALRPESSSIFEICALRFTAPGVLSETWNPLFSIPLIPSYTKQLTNSYQLSHSELQKYPPLSQQLPHFFHFLQNQTLIAYQCSEHLETLRSLSSSSFTLESWLCLKRLALRLLPQLATPSLKGLANHFQLSLSPSPRAYEKAFISAQIFIKLTELAYEQKLFSLEALRTFQWSKRLSPHPPWYTPEEWPAKPGIFRIWNSEKRLLYIGKATHLQNTLTQLFHPQSQTTPRSTKLKRLFREMAHLDYEIYGHELEAQVQEAFLIRRYKPPYNQILSKISSYTYLKLQPLQLSLSSKFSNKGYFFGPFRSPNQAEKFKESLLLVFPPPHPPKASPEILPLFDSPLSSDPLSLNSSTLPSSQETEFFEKLLSLLQENSSLEIQALEKRIRLLPPPPLQREKLCIQEALQQLRFLKEITSHSYLVLLPGTIAGVYHLLPVIQGRVQPIQGYDRYLTPLETLAHKLFLLYFNTQYSLNTPLKSIELYSSLLVYKQTHLYSHNFPLISMDNLENAQELYEELLYKIPLLSHPKPF